MGMARLHASHLSKAECHAEFRKTRLKFPQHDLRRAPRLGSAVRRVEKNCQAVDVLLLPPLEHDELPQPQRVVALARTGARRRCGGRTPAGNSRAAGCAGDSSVSANSSRRLPRNQTPSGTPKPCFRRSRIVPRQQRRRDFLQHVLAAAVLDLQRRPAAWTRTRSPRCRAAARATRSSAPCSCGRPWSARLRADRSRRRSASSGSATAAARSARNGARAAPRDRARRCAGARPAMSSAGFSSAPKKRIASR